MFLKHLSIINFKNYKNQKIDFQTPVAVLTGKNGMGKTNLLDAICYLAFTRSAINSIDQQNVAYGAPFFTTKGEIERKGKIHTIQCSYEVSGGKKFLVNDHPLEKLSAHIGEFPVVMVSPNDTTIVREWSDLRRKFFEGLISKVNSDYLHALIRYNHFLKQRNALLKGTSKGKTPDLQLLDNYDHELVKNGTLLWSTRQQFLGSFLPVFLKRHQLLSGNEQVGIRYQSDFDNTDPMIGLMQNRQKDFIMQRSTFGVHRDDFEFLLGEHPLKRSGSQGQYKSFVIALRIAQYEIIKDRKGFSPILLLDDVFDKLDDSRIDHLTEMIDTDYFGQIFITDARPERTSKIVKQLHKKVQIFSVENGEVSPGQ